MYPDVLFYNARVLTFDPARPRAGAVAVAGGRVVALPREPRPRALIEGARKAHDLKGAAVLPGFVDAHLHLLASAAAYHAVDCSPEAAPSIEAIQRLVRERAAELPPGEWIRARGYDEYDLAEGRHPTRRDLDRAAPRYPVRLQHRTGHASVLNSLALGRCGISRATPEPPGGFMEREVPSGEPTGLLMEMEELVEAAIPPLSREALLAGMQRFEARLLAQGVTTVFDAGRGNGPAEFALFDELARRGHFRPRLLAAQGLASFLAGEEGDGRPVKVILSELGPEVYPRGQALADILRRIHEAGRQEVVHAVGRPAVEAVVGAFATLGRDLRGRRHRLEHCGVCPPPLAARIADLGLTVVSQPGFLYHNGDRYLWTVPPNEQHHLYPFRTLAAVGVPLAAGSDSPVGPSEPLSACAAARDRRTRSGAVLNPAEALAPDAALVLWTSAAAAACGVEGEAGALREGAAADLVVIEGDPLVSRDAQVALTVLGGEIVSRRGDRPVESPHGGTLEAMAEGEGADG